MSASGEMEHFKQGFQAASVELIANLERLLAAENSKPSELALVRASNVQYGRAAATFDGALSRIPDGASTVAMEIDLRDYLTTMVTAFEPAAEVKDLRIEVDCLDHAHVKVRAHLLDAVLHNLIGNAVKYTDQGSVTVRCRSNEGRTVQVEVVDTGIGIDPDTLLHLTEPGVRGQAANVLSRPGDGLGLASAAAAARELGGTLSFTSSLGKGTRAVLELRTTQD
jgi:signal transduction histidine kinase